MKKFLLCLMLAFSLHATAADPALTETRYTSVIVRAPDSSISRRSDVLTAFQHIHPCPSTGKETGACPGWAKDHVISLACGGKDEVSNLQWLPNSIKSCANDRCKDRFERKIYYSTQFTIPDTLMCKKAIVK